MLSSHSILIFISFSCDPHLLPFSIPIHPRKHSNLSPLPSPSFPYTLPPPPYYLILRVATLIYVCLSIPNLTLITQVQRYSPPTSCLCILIVSSQSPAVIAGMVSALLPPPFCSLAIYMQSPSPSPLLSYSLLPYLLCLSIMGKKHSFALHWLGHCQSHG